jgi:hypothetical protein
MYGIFAFDRLTLAYVGYVFHWIFRTSMSRYPVLDFILFFLSPTHRYSTFSLALAFSTFFIALSKDGGLPSDPVFIVCYASYVLYSITLVPTNTGPYVYLGKKSAETLKRKWR